MRKLAVAVSLIAATLGASPAPDQLRSLGYLVGSWSCTFHGAVTSTYKAFFAYDAGGNWLLEHDTFAGGGGEGRFTYDPKGRRWIVVFTGSDRSATVFEGTGDADHIVYRTVYPQVNASERFDRVSSSKFTLRYERKANGQTWASHDDCLKQ